MGTGAGETFFTEWEETFESFDQMNLHENLLRGIYGYGEPHARRAAWNTRPGDSRIHVPAIGHACGAPRRPAGTPGRQQQRLMARARARQQQLQAHLSHPPLPRAHRL